MSHRIDPQLAWEEDGAKLWERLNPASRGPCRICKVDEEDHDSTDHEYEPCEPVKDDA